MVRHAALYDAIGTVMCQPEHNTKISYENGIKLTMKSLSHTHGLPISKQRRTNTGVLTISRGKLQAALADKMKIQSLIKLAKKLNT